ncbi:T9SS type A sorting domain-containing protein [Epilithonimonas caeni]|uniref:T9SS type A sorting domain-containing protein n=1 Tax=Epilithonimonas caeni TaxID=365343 RepID=UPI000414EF1E|nr:T9SS type A sorting domain-containing protein [Epilithonimonas caeni]
MKKFYILIFAANLCFAQNSDLLNTDWQVTKVVGELFPDQFPPPIPYQQVTHFDTDFPQFSLSFFNNISANLTYSGENTFTVNSKTCTLADYWGDNGEVNQFFGRLCSFFTNSQSYYYNIVSNGSGKTLTIGNAIFEEIHFKSATLGTKDNELTTITAYPNPATDIVKIENLKPSSSLELIDSSGKLVRSVSNIKQAKTEINIKNLPAGIYYLKVDGISIQKIIKK